MSKGLRVPNDFDQSGKRDIQDELDRELNKYSFTHHNQVFEDSPNKSELNQFGDFSGSHSQFGGSASLERGMGGMEKSTDLSFRSKSAMPPMSTLSSLSSRTDSPRKARSEGGRRSSSIHRFSPVTQRKVTALGIHESESEYSPSKFYQASRTPHAASRLNPQPTRKVSPKSFKNTAALFEDLGLENSMQNGNSTVAPDGQSFRLPREREVPDYSTLVQSTRKKSHKVIDSVPVPEDNQKLFTVLQKTQAVVESLGKQNQHAQSELQQSREALQRAEENLKAEQRRATFAENELKQHLSAAAKPGTDDKTLKLLEARNSTLANALASAKKDLENRSLELELAREEATAVNEERNRAIERLANALERVERLTAENETLRIQVALLKDQRSKETIEAQTVDERITQQVRKQRSITPTSVKEPSKKGKKTEEVDSDVGVSKSILNESELEDLTQEIAERRRKNAAKSTVQRRKVSHDREAAKPKAHQKIAERVSSTSKVQGKQREQAPARNLKRSQKTRRRAPSVELTEDESFASDEQDFEAEDFLTDSELSSDADLDFVSTAEDEPSRILYRRVPARQVRGKPSTASRVDVQKVVSELSGHDIAKCTVCARKAVARKEHAPEYAQRQPSRSHEFGEDADVTIRPSQAPVLALNSILAALQDEFRHLRLKYHGLTESYNQVDPSLGRRKRKSLAAELRSTIEGLEGKADQIYSIFDVLEAANSGMPLKEDGPKPSQASRREWLHT